MGPLTVTPLPPSHAYFQISSNAPAGTELGFLFFHLQTTHWQPWLDDVSFDNLTLSFPDGSFYSAGYFTRGDSESGRLVGIHQFVLPGLRLDSLPYTATLSSSAQSVQLQIDLKPLGCDAP